MRRPGYLGFGYVHPVLGNFNATRFEKLAKKRALVEQKWARKDEKRELKRLKQLKKMEMKGVDPNKIAKYQEKWDIQDTNISEKRDRLRAAWAKVGSIQQEVEQAKAKQMPVSPQTRANLQVVKQEVHQISAGKPNSAMQSLLRQIEMLEAKIGA